MKRSHSPFASWRRATAGHSLAGALVPGAPLILRNTDTGAIYQTKTTKTTETGNYTLPSLPAGNYELTVATAGFSKYVQQGIRVQMLMLVRRLHGSLAGWRELPSLGARMGVSAVFLH